jgi:hypothetical protein
MFLFTLINFSDFRGNQSTDEYQNRLPTGEYGNSFSLFATPEWPGAPREFFFAFDKVLQKNTAVWLMRPSLLQFSRSASHP